MAYTPGSVVREVLTEDGWSVARRSAWHPLWGWVAVLDAVVLMAEHRAALQAFVERGATRENGGFAEC